MTTQHVGKNCDGGHSCSPPKDCCKQGCCYLPSTSVFRPPVMPTGNMFNPLFLGHWYFWLAVTATVAGILCACSLWRRHNHGSICCRDPGREDRASEPDSNGSCYAPPQYSRCNSFHQAPPPYSEVASKPDLYPLVISYNGDPVIKNSNNSTGYLMVQYFRNFIVRPVGSLSATSTIDSLSSSFICNAANEANTIIPPPYSSMGSLEEVTCEVPRSQSIESRHLPRSASSISGAESYQRSPSVHSHLSGLNTTPSAQSTPAHFIVNPRPTSVVSIRDNPCFGQNTTNILHTTPIHTTPTPPSSTFVSNSNKDVAENVLSLKPQNQTTVFNNCDALPPLKVNNNNTKKFNLHKIHSQDSESQDDDHNFSDLLNLSVCVPSSVINFEAPIQSHVIAQELQYSVTNSMTGSDISSLANLGTPDSPPRATSPTVEMKELLDKIQQLPQQKSPIQQNTPHNQMEPNRSSKSYFHRSKAKTLYMPLYEGPNASCSSSNNNNNNCRNKPSQTGKVFTRSWLSRSAPTTPCSNFVPNFPVHKKNNSGSQKGSKSKTAITDGSPLLKEHEESEEDTNRDECL